ncbi:leukocyte cell-derived chemotaxin-2-like [Sphaeramia orbicularis]|uniref:Leukocyte cell-derived chemotaxin-2-like n=1 Tax=Sphaeramia orbicularis TaxID=375764 RepID=A0A672YLS0_9TELE|nr:leukocyte cell-derived chemotaxin-2-like [Sphaeramia orbicularis]
MRHAVLLLALICACDALTFGQLCSSYPTNTPRTSDIHGQGHFGARRTYGSHEGIDITCNDGDTVYAPFDLTVVRGLIVYSGGRNAAINKGIVIQASGLCFKLFYVDPVQTSGSLKKGDVLGTMMPMQEVYPGITSHVHVMLCDKTDPTGYF